LLRLLVRVRLPPALLRLVGVLRRVVVPEDLEPLFGRQRNAHLLRLHGAFHRRDHLPEPVHPPGQQLVLAAQVGRGVGTGIVENGRDLFEREAEFLVVQDLLQSFEIVLGVPPVPGPGASTRREQPDLVVVVQGTHADAGVARDLPDRVVHGFPPSDVQAAA